MTVETFFANFGHLADAPNGVQKLRELILQLAVQGKLVPQDFNEEPASALLEKVESEKKRLKELGKIKKLPTAEAVNKDEILFRTPQGWEWPRLDTVCSYIQRGKGPKYVEQSDIPVVSQKCVQWAGFTLAPARFICPSTLEKYAEERFLRTGDLLWNSTGTGTIGRINVYKHEDNPYEKVVADSHVTVVRPVLLDSGYIWIWLASPYIQADLEGNASGSTNQVELATSVVKAHVIPLPPLEEQKRIVAKVDQLMALCDELEDRQQKQQQGRMRLNNATLDALLTASEADEFADHWQRISTNFDLLYDHPETIAKLRAAILQLAVQGKLVTQDPNDEPASTLLERIKAEKGRLVKEKLIRKEKPLAAVQESAYPFQLPSAWEWTRLGTLCKVVEYGTSQKSHDHSSGVPVLRMNNIDGGRVHHSNLKYVGSDIKDLPKLYLKQGEILFNRTNSYELVGKAGVFEGNDDKFTFASYLIRASLFQEEIVPAFVNYALNSSYFRITQIEPEITQQCGQANFNGTKLKNTLVPLPSRAEQKRIVAKVDQLMTLCDKLEAKLNQAKQHSEKLMESTLRQVSGTEGI
ncbi:restriction endonuclease subunit S [Desulfuromonas acetoxidans]|uniref:restriction endonuclease subunit S n=1 Tax=Desulfuromonas acetoxidans TaxID=891 RepID=UPI00293114D0|nr:restriction endonuclease subunit S [Desulfuromonas acetoxidans]